MCRQSRLFLIVLSSGYNSPNIGPTRVRADRFQNSRLLTTSYEATRTEACSLDTSTLVLILGRQRCKRISRRSIPESVRRRTWHRADWGCYRSFNPKRDHRAFSKSLTQLKWSGLVIFSNLSQLSKSFSRANEYSRTVSKMFGNANAAYNRSCEIISNFSPHPIRVKRYSGFLPLSLLVSAKR